MNGVAVLELALSTSEMVTMAYLSDLSDTELMMRPHPKCNHLNWQIGHLISSEHEMMKTVAAEKMPPLPDGFAEKYSKEHAASDDPAEFATKEELMAAYRAQRDGTLSILRGMADDDLDRETGIHYAPTVGALINMQSAHWLMHCGQWVVVRRETGKPVVI